MVNESANVKITLNGEQAQQELEALQGEMKRLIELKKKAETAGDIEGWKKIDDQLKKNLKTQKQLEKNYADIENTLRNLNGASLNDLTRAKDVLLKRVRSLTQGTKEWVAANNDLQKVKSKITEVGQAMGTVQTPVQKLIGFAKGLLPAFSFAAIAAGAVATFNSIKNSTDTLSTQWEIFIGGMNQATNEFFRTLATGDWSNFIDNMENAVRVGREYAKTLDEIEENQRALDMYEADMLQEKAELEIKLRSKNISKDDREAAGKRRIEIEEQLAERRAQIAEKAYNNDLNKAIDEAKLGKDRLLQLSRDFDSETKIKAQALIDQQTELKKLTDAAIQEASQTGIAATETPRMKQLRAEIDATDKTVKDYAFAMIRMGNTTDEQLNKVAAGYVKWKEAQNSALDNTKRIRVQVNNLLSGKDEDGGIGTGDGAKTTATDIAPFIDANFEQKKAALRKYFDDVAKIKEEAALTDPDIADKYKTEETEGKDPALDYALKKYMETNDYKLAMNQAMYDKSLIGKQEYEDNLTRITEEDEEKRTKIVLDAEEEKSKKRNEKARAIQDIAFAAGNTVMALMDLELEKAGENEEKKKEIRKKYADINFAVTVAQIIASTALGIMQGFAQLGPIAGAIMAVLVGATGAVQVGVANAQRQQVKAYAAGKYPGLQTGMYGDKPHYALFNEVPGQPEMVVDGLTTRKLQINYPEIINTIYRVRDGLQPQYADGKYPYSSFSEQAQSAGLGDEDQNKVIAALATAVDKLSKNIDYQTKNPPRPVVAVESFERERKRYIEIQTHRGL